VSVSSPVVAACVWGLPMASFCMYCGSELSGATCDVCFPEGESVNTANARNDRSNWSHIRVRRSTKALLEAKLASILKAAEDGKEIESADLRCHERHSLDFVIRTLLAREGRHRERGQKAREKKRESKSKGNLGSEMDQRGQGA